MGHVRNNQWFKALFDRYNRSFLLPRHFHFIGVRGEPDLQDPMPILYMMNHSSWWDGLLVYHVIRRLSRRSHYMMMDDVQLRRYRFFRKLGAFPIDKSSMRGVKDALTVAGRLLSPANGVWIFPQGDICHLEARPLRFAGGIAWLLQRWPDTAVVPVTAYYTFGRHQKADATLWFGEPIRDDWTVLSRAELTEQLRNRLECQLDAHRALAVDYGDVESGGFVAAARVGRSTDEWFDTWRRRLSR